MVTSLASKVVTIVQQILIVPIMIKSLSAAEYGQYIVLISYFGWLSMIQGSTNPGLTSVVAEIDQRRDRDEIARVFFTTFQAMLIISAAIYLLTAFGIWLSGSQQAPALYVLAFFSVFLLALGQIDALMAGLLKQYVSNAFATISNICTLLAALVVSVVNPTILGFVLGIYGTPFVLRLIYMIYVRRRVLNINKIPMLSKNYRTLLDIWRPGSAFVGIQLAVFLNQGLLYIVLSNFKGHEFVVRAFLISRLVGLLGSVAAMFSMIFWPHIVSANSRNEEAWVRQVFRISIGSAVLYGAIVAMLLYIWGAGLIHIWSRGAVTEIGDAFGPFSILFFLSVLATINSSYIIGHKSVWFVAACVLVENLIILAAVAIMHEGLDVTDLGWIFVVANLVTVAWLYPTKIYRINKRNGYA